MSVTSVRNAVKAALADKKVTLAEAKKITQVAGRTSGVSAAEKKEIAKALDADAFFQPAAKAHLLAAIGSDSSGGPKAKALEQLLNGRGLDFFDQLKPANKDKFGEGLNAGLEKFAEILGNSDGDSLAYGAQELKLGSDTLTVVTDYDYDKEKELVGFFTKDGKELGRASISTKNDALKMSWEMLDGKAVKKPIETKDTAQEVKLPAGFKKDLEAFVTENYGELGGKDIGAKDMPPEVRRHWLFMQRTIADGTGAEKLQFQGKTLYALHDYSCVTSVHLFTEDGKKVLAQTE